MNMKCLKTVYKKEILDVLRDKKTVFTMLVLPILLYPLLFFIALQVMSFVTTDQKTKEYQIAFVQGAGALQTDLMNWIESDEDGYDYSFQVVEESHPLEALKQEKIDACIEVNEKDGQHLYRIHYLSASTNSSNALSYLEEEIESYRIHCAKQKLKSVHLDVKEYLYPVESEASDLSSQESSLGNMLGGFIPFLLIVSIVMATMYPAIDTTAGERERGTLETMLTLPVRNRELMMGKFLSVATIAVASVMTNFLSIGAIVAYLVATLKELHVAGTDFSIGSFVPAILISILCVACFALFMSAVVMCVCAFAKSFKEANNYITPIALVVLMISYVGFVPSIELNRITAMIPVANISLLIKNLLVFKYDFSMIILVLCSNVAYALLAIGVLSRIYHSEALLFGDSALGITLFERRKNIQKGAMPSVQDGLFVIVITFLLVVYLGGILSLKMPILGIFVPQACMILIPLMVCWYTKGKVGKIFSLKMPKIRELLASLVLYIGVGSLSMVMSEGLSRFFPGEAESVGYTYGQVLGDVPFPVALLVIAVLPAICEEMMFRGYLLTSFSGKMKAFPAMLLVAGLFACSHMSLIKLLPTFVLGMALCYAVYQTKSIVCSAVMHFLNNALSVGILYYGDMISWLQDETMANKVLIDLFIIAVLCIPMGIMLLRERRFYAKIS